MWSPRWGGLRWVGMRAGDILALTVGGSPGAMSALSPPPSCCRSAGRWPSTSALITERMRRVRARRVRPTLIGYVADVEQTPGTLLGIKALQTLYPCVAFFIAAAILIFLYPLTDAR